VHGWQSRLWSGSGFLSSTPDTFASFGVYAVFCFNKRGLNSANAPGDDDALSPASSWLRPAGSRLPLAKQRQPRIPATQTAAPPRPALQHITPFMLLEREVELEYRSRREESLQNKVGAVADSLRGQTPVCSRCSQPMKRHDTETVSWTARFGRFHAPVDRYRCPACKEERRPLLDHLGVALTP